MTTKTRVALIGVGYWGKNLLRNFVNCNQTELVGIYDTNTELAKEKVAQYPNLKLYENLDSLFGDESVQGVAIATPVRSHCSLAMQAMKANKHVLVEKPLCLSYADAASLVTEATKRELTLMCDHTFCYSGPVIALRNIVQSGVLGNLLYINSVRTNLGLFQKDVNVLWDLAPHDLSIARFVLGDKYSPTGLIASATTHPDSPHVADAHMSLNLGNGATFNVHNSWLSPVKVRQMTLVGTKNMVVWDDLLPNEKIKVYEKGVSENNGTFEYLNGSVVVPPIDQKEPLLEVVQEFADHITNGTTPRLNATDACDIVRILEMANISLENNQYVTL
jgi:predicted dehydrogenase